ncbi:DUF2075 domain-containing protein [Streptomyces sp. NPDC001514]
MLLLQLSARHLLQLHARNRLLPHMAARWMHFKGTDASDTEKAAWKESLVRLAEELVEAGHGEVHMFVECQPDGVAAPADVILVGVHPETRHDSLLVVELKRWSSVGRSDKPEKVEVPGMEPKKHPSAQVRQVIDYFQSDSGPLRGLSVAYAGLTYLHNATTESVHPLLEAGVPTGAHALYFTEDTRRDLLDEVNDRFGKESGAPAAERLLQRLGLRNTPLLEAMALSEGEDTVFTLRGEQKTVWRDVKKAVEYARAGLPNSRQRAVFLVKGGAGSGKSAIGLELLRYFTAQGREVRYASGSRAFDASMKYFIRGDEHISVDQFVYFHHFVEAPEPPLDLLICDEAHRLRERSTNRFWPPERQGMQPQVDELIKAARVTVFLLDENQSVRRDEVGTGELIEQAALRHGVTAQLYGLQTEFRCGGSDSYRQWVLDLLGISGESAEVWSPDGLMHVEVADSVESLEAIVRSEQWAGATARMVAGFCWPWSDPDELTHELHLDVQIGDWHRPWNAKGDRSSYSDGAPPAKLWAAKAEGIGQIGCVYSAQGLEWDWCGVIMGDDMVWRDGAWVFNRGKSSPPDENGKRHLLKSGSVDTRIPHSSGEGFAKCIRNAYHVLLTRASRATVLYSTDRLTQEYLKEKVGPVDVQGLRPSWKTLPPEQLIARESRALDARSMKRRMAAKGQKKAVGKKPEAQLDLFGF